jgi:hypothetical protein
MKHKSLTKAHLAESAGGVESRWSDGIDGVDDTAAKGQIESAGCR